ncbi:L-histidine N(alpha)-methyltransferase [Chryseobacterium lactis]|uniref:L-histidine N(Alpha)-methyltransferase n=1 Tax=Chryseobacterium lactis TaxID=1241981 RepID=A0A3G6RIG0_CHRLC|nr:L-histidine N(alpha)-methyltransferase [Chryseobacterium lactis]AZA84373.1 L-histidine N(alpha)-methyltransferase [Chryseobacterium lactis]AZB04761.1 L-histidine N(alpha)-methyltransferase [Chryseobacterium lactis]PNW14491.1 L-histidine N(alpha)-methyltransferase [Chryseobacterium lactis]
MNIQLKQEHQLKNDYAGSFLQDVLKGLSAQPKKLSSKYFYDKTGDHLFQQIMAMPEYYLTHCELNIFQNKTEELAKAISNINESFDLIELGAGDAMKSSYLLKNLVEKGTDFTYMPIDISGNILTVLQKNLQEKLPELKILPLEGEYFDMLDKATGISKRKKVVLFLGGNIGNMEVEEARHFCSEVKRKLNPGDLFLVGFDLKKNPNTILAAYNDPAGITASFNLNLLTRINRELNADFNEKQFQHYQTYDPVSGACRSFLVSLCDQDVHVGNQLFHFKENELIDMEISQKFSEQDIKKLAGDSGFHILSEIKDAKNWFVDSIWMI